MSKNQELEKVIYTHCETVKEFAQLIEVPLQTVYNWLYGHATPEPGVYTLRYTKEVERRLEILSFRFNPHIHFFETEVEYKPEVMSELDKREIYKRFQNRAYPDVAHVYDMLKILDARSQKILILYYIDDLDSTEISKLLGISRQRVHQIKNKALNKLKDCMHCTKCESHGYVLKSKGPHMGAYCAKCDAWIKWIPRAEIKGHTIVAEEITLSEEEVEGEVEEIEVEDCPF